ncbi:hypothetical protein SLS59_000763 [Nothophoma quercina]|uniref:Uncharacterized protein n=1 Tax=Nothophoma quercina TaxID=749835 RepID=A0ABR3S361_9PLEO
MVLIIAEHFYERWIYSAIFEAVETFIIRPDHADIESPDAVSKDRATSILGLQRRSPPLIRNAINKMLVLLGWSDPATLNETAGKSSLDSEVNPGQSVDVAGAQLTDLAPLEIPVSRTERPATDGAHDSVTVPIQIADDLIRPTTPPTPTASDHDDNDPRIRITSREGIVEMEMIGAIVKAQLVGLAVLPFKLVVLRLVASHFLTSQEHIGSTPRFVEPFPNLSDLSIRSIGIGISRVALCAASELAIDLTLWSAQYLAVITVGKNLFGWGVL